MTLMEYINNHMPQFWFATGFALLVIEALVLGFSSGAVLFAAGGALIAGALLQFGLLPHTWVAGVAAFGLGSAMCTAVLWRPLMRLQAKTDAVQGDRSSDLIGYTFRLDSPLSAEAPSSTRYSGIDWEVRLDPAAGVEKLDAGTQVSVSAVSTGRFTVKPA